MNGVGGGGGGGLGGLLATAQLLSSQLPQPVAGVHQQQQGLTAGLFSGGAAGSNLTSQLSVLCSQIAALNVNH